jgi:uncharacterized surface protein with fasciclin (FAS1) repeats
LTILAPTDAAFANATSTPVADLIQNVTYVRDLLNRHIVPGNVYSPLSVSNLTTLGNESLHVITNGNNETFIDGALVLTRNNTLAANGVLHVIDQLLL